MASITSLGIGSGLDLNGLLDQLRQAERAKLEPFAQQKQVYQSRISAYGQLEGAMSQLQAAVKALGDTTHYQRTQSSVEGSSIAAAAGNGAALGSYSVEVIELARSSSVATAGVEDKTVNLGGGVLTLEFGDQSSTEITIDEDNSSLEAIRDAINAAKAGVRASILHDGGDQPYRLVLASENSGTQAAIADVDFGDLSAALSIDTATRMDAQDASLIINGITISSQSNQVEGAIEGVTLQLKEAGVSTLEVRHDRDSAANVVKAFVSAYNRLQDNMAQLASYDSASGRAGELLGDPMLRGFKSQVRTALSGIFGEGELRMAADIGLKLEVNGKITLDEARLNALTEQDLDGLSAFLTGADTGLAARLGVVLEPVLAKDGSLSRAKEGLDALIERLGERQDRVERSIEDTMERYRKQFADMDRMVAGMNATSAYLFQQFDMMNAQLGRK